MKKKILLIVVLILILATILLFIKVNNGKYDQAVAYTKTLQVERSQKQSSSKPATSKPVEKAPIQNSVKEVKTFSLADIASHNSESSCWSTVSGKVYDLTTFITKHPGGAKAILTICGKDGTDLFNDQHSMDPKAKGLLPNFYLGEFTQ